MIGKLMRRELLAIRNLRYPTRGVSKNFGISWSSVSVKAAKTTSICSKENLSVVFLIFTVTIVSEAADIPEDS